MRNHFPETVTHTDGWAANYTIENPSSPNDWVSARWRSAHGHYVMERTHFPGYWVVLDFHRGADSADYFGPFMDLHEAKTALILMTGG